MVEFEVMTREQQQIELHRRSVTIRLHCFKLQSEIDNVVTGLTRQERDLITDYYLNFLSDNEIMIKHGKTWNTKLNRLLKRIEKGTPEYLKRLSFI